MYESGVYLLQVQTLKWKDIVKSSVCKVVTVMALVKLHGIKLWPPWAHSLVTPGCTCLVCNQGKLSVLRIISNI